MKLVVTSSGKVAAHFASEEPMEDFGPNVTVIDESDVEFFSVLSRNGETIDHADTYKEALSVFRGCKSAEWIYANY